MFVKAGKTLLLLVLAVSGNLLAFSGGDGSVGSPYQISEFLDFEEFMTLTVSDSTYLSKCYLQTSDIDLSDVPLDTALIAGDGTAIFTGVYDGGYHKLSNMNLNEGQLAEVNYLGLFGRVGEGAVIKNVIMDGVSIYGKWYIGAVAGECYGSVENCKVVNVDITGNHRVGGLVGKFGLGAVNNCSSAGTVTMITNGGGYIGGLIGSCVTDGIVLNNCYSVANLDNVFEYYGGLIGRAGKITLNNCYYAGLFDESSDVYLIGAGQPVYINNCFYTSDGVDLYDQATFTGWDFMGEAVNGTDDIWVMPMGGMPILYYEAAALISGLAATEFELMTNADLAFDVPFEISGGVQGACEGYSFEVPADVDWLTISLIGSEGVLSDPVAISAVFDMTGKAAGVYEADVVFTAGADMQSVVIPFVVTLIDTAGLTELEEVAASWLADCETSDCSDAEMVLDGYIDMDDFAVLAVNWMTSVVDPYFYDTFEKGELSNMYWSNATGIARAAVTDGYGLLGSSGNWSIELRPGLTGSKTMTFDYYAVTQSMYSLFSVAVDGNVMLMLNNSQASANHSVDVELEADSVVTFFLSSYFVTGSIDCEIDNVKVE